MSLIFDSQKHRSVGTSCPSCSTISEDSHDFEIQCKSCGIWYLRVTEVFDVEPPAYPPALSSRTNHSPAEFGKPSFNNISYGPKPPSQFQALPSSPKRKLDSTELEEDDLSQFKRVRLVRKERRVKGVSNPFLQHPISSKSALDSADKQQKDEELALDELRALQVSLGDVHPQTLIRLHSYARLLRNWGKYQTAEMIIRDALQSGEAELLAHRPEILQLMLSGLMTVLVDQQKLVEAEELWHTWVETFRIKLGEDSAKVLEEQFRQAHPLRPLSTVTLEGAVFFDTTTSVNQPVALGNTTFVTAPSSDDELEHSNEIVISNQDATKSGLLGLFGPFGANSAYKNVGAALQPSTDIVEAQKESEDSQELGTPSSPSPINFIRLQKEYSGSKTSALQYDQPSFQRITTGKYSLNDFEILRTVGTGTFARVHLIKSIHNKRFYALKVLKKQNIVKLKQVEHACEERRILSKIKHPFLITLWGTFSDSKNLYMVTDYAEGGELFSLLRKSHRFPDPVAKFYAAEVILAIAYLHSRHIVYRDIKPENILLDRYGHIKLCDFGFAKETEDCIWTLCGTPDYLAPEIVASKGHSHSVDWWALGVLIFEMLCGFTPFWDGDSHIRTYTNILRCKVKYPPHIHPNARDLLQSLITPDLTRRLGNLTGGVRDIQEHAWFQEVTWERLQNRDIEAPYILPIKPGGGDTSQYDKYPEEAELYSDMEPDEYSHLFEDF